MNGYDSEGSSDGLGWVMFAGTMIAIAGVLNMIYGIAAIDDSNVFVSGSHYVVFSDLNTWGWVHTIVGAIQIMAAFAIWSQQTWGRVVGVLSAGFSAIAILLFVTAAPFAGLGIFIIDILVIYGLVAHGGRSQAAAA